MLNASDPPPVKHLTIRDVPPELSEALEREKRQRGRSLNRTVIELLSQALGVGPGRRRSNGLRALAGTWSASDLREFEEAIASTDEIDAELWR